MIEPGSKSISAPTGPPRPASVDTPQLDILRQYLGPLLVGGRPFFDPLGAIVTGDAARVWTWLGRDVVTDLSKQAGQAVERSSGSETLAEFSRTIAATIAEQLQLALENPELERRIRVQIGDESAFLHLKQVANGFRCQPYLAKAVAFGRALDHQRDEQAVALSLKSFPARRSPLMPMLMHAAMSQVINPARIVTVITQLAGGATARALTQSGFASILDALMAHAQNQLSLMSQQGPFADIDLECRAVSRFHALVRATSIVAENDSHSVWAVQSAKMVARLSDQLSPRIARIEADVRQSLRPPRAGEAQLNSDALLEALNGLYLLVTVREARDSLGVNSVLDSAWTQTGQVLETLISRNLEAYKADPANELNAMRLDAAINMARIRFNPEYADVISKAKQGVVRQPASSQISA